MDSDAGMKTNDLNGKFYAIAEKDGRTLLVGPGSFFMPNNELTMDNMCHALNIAFHEGYRFAQKQIRSAIGAD